MAQAKHVSKVKRSGNAVKVLGIAGASLAASASGSTAMMMMDTTPFEVGNPDQAYTLNDEELSDVSLATFHFFDEEALGTIPSGIQLARGCGCGHGCGGGRGCGGRGLRRQGLRRQRLRRQGLRRRLGRLRRLWRLVRLGRRLLPVLGRLLHLLNAIVWPESRRISNWMTEPWRA